MESNLIWNFIDQAKVTLLVGAKRVTLVLLLVAAARREGTCFTRLRRVVRPSPWYADRTKGYNSGIGGQLNRDAAKHDIWLICEWSP